MDKIKIGNKIIGREHPCFIIAEAGLNHNKSLDIAKKMVDTAKSCGADAVKFQTFKPQDLVTAQAVMASYQKKNLGCGKSQLDMLNDLALSYEDFIELNSYCDKKKIIFLSTPHTQEAVDFLDSMLPAYKISSADLTNFPLLEKVSRKKKPVILSTGMASLSEARDAVNIVRGNGNKNIILLHCTSNYPCLLEEVNLKAMLKLEESFNCLVGYSDHSEGNIVSLMAVALGAVVIEKHFTLDRNMPGPDHRASLDPFGLKSFVSDIRRAGIILGDGIKKPAVSEKKTMMLVRKSIVAKNNIAKGAKITAEMLVIKRPGTGLAPRNLHRIINKKAVIDIKKDSLIKFGDLA